MPKKKRGGYKYIPSGIHSIGRVFPPEVPGAYDLTPSLYEEIGERLQGTPLTASLKAGLLAALVEFRRVYKPHEFALRWREHDAPGKLNEQQIHKVRDKVELLRAALYTVQQRLAAIDALVAERGTDAKLAGGPSTFADADETAALDRLQQRCDMAIEWHDHEFKPRGRGAPLQLRRRALRDKVLKSLEQEGISTSTHLGVCEGVLDVIDREADRLEGRAVTRKGDAGSNNRRLYGPGRRSAAGV